MRVREAGRAGRLVAAALAALWLPSCGNGPQSATAVDLDSLKTAEEHRKALDRMEGRSDPEAWRARALICERLVKLGEPDPANLLAHGDAADLELLALAGAPPEYKAESAGRLSRHFRDRAKTPGLSRIRLDGPLAGPLRRVMLLTAAGRFGEYASRAELAASLDALAYAEQELASLEGLKPGVADEWKRRAKADLARAEALRGNETPPEPAPEVRKFCEYSLARHREEAARTANEATSEKVKGGSLDRSLPWFLDSLAHYAVAGECLVSPSVAERQSLAAMDIVVRSLTDLLRRGE